MKKKNEAQVSSLIKPTLLNNNIFLFIYTLIKYIFLKYNNKKGSNSISKKLNDWIDAINSKIIKKEKYFLSREYSIENLKNIIYFLKKQNYKYCGDIMEQILIKIFSLIFQAEQDTQISKYIFNNLNMVREHQSHFENWIKKGVLKPPSFEKLEDLFDIDGNEEEYNIGDAKDNSIFYNCLQEILRKKYLTNIYEYNIKNNKNIFFINHGNNLHYEISSFIYNDIRRHDANLTILDKDIKINSIMNIKRNLTTKISYENLPIIQLIHIFFTQVFIYYQNKNSPLLKYAEPKENYAEIPFLYDLRGGCLEGRFAFGVLSPLRIDDSITKIFLKQNNLRECGMFELGKLCIFNNNVKVIECDTCLIRSNYLNYLTEAMGVFDNYSVEEINLSYNYLREDCEESIIKILIHFKNLKTLNLASNELHGALSGIFVVLKKLYRQNKSKVENLVLNKTVLDDPSFYELGELLKCKYCKLQKIYFNNNPIPANLSFLRKLKKNRSLREIYLDKSDVNNSSMNDILKIISNSHIRTLYLYKNKLNNFNDFLRILFRTKIIKKKKNKKLVIKNENTALINLDLSNNDFPIKNSSQLELLKKIIQETTLYCLDMCHILSIEKKKDEDAKYTKEIQNIKTLLENQKNNYINVVKEIRKSKVNMNKYKEFYEKDYEKKYKIEKYENDLYGNENTIYPVYMKMLAKKIIQEQGNDEDKKNENESVNKLAKYLTYENSKYNLKELEIKEQNKKLIII